jgi:hypothetical protein
VRKTKGRRRDEKNEMRKTRGGRRREEDGD